MNRRDAADLAGTIGLGSWLAFGVLTVVVVDQDGASPWLDTGFLAWSVGHRPDVAVALARGVTDTGSGAIPYVLAVVAGVVVGRTAKHRLLAAVVGLACLGAGQTMRYGIMDLIARPRPAHTDWAAQAGGSVFPSGHTTTATLTAGLLITAVSLRAPTAPSPHRPAVRVLRRSRRLPAQAVPSRRARRPTEGRAQTCRATGLGEGRRSRPGCHPAQCNSRRRTRRAVSDGVPSAGHARCGGQRPRGPARPGRGAWPDGAQVSDNTLDQYLSRLRRKLREADSRLGLTTVRGVGHRLS